MVSEVSGDGPRDDQTLIRVTVKTERGGRVVAGTLFGGTRARVVQVQDIHFEAEVGRRMLFVRNRDKPGFIGKLGSILGGAGVNIANFHLGRSASGGSAIALVEIDGPVPEAALEAVRALPDVIQARSEEPRVGQECVSTCATRVAPIHSKKT